MAESKVSALEGNELADDYTRTNVPKGRWADTWAIVKANFTGFVFINILTLLFCIPAIVVLLFRLNYIASAGIYYPFSANIGFGYPGLTNATGMAESVYFNADMLFYSALIAAGFIAAVGISGGMYSTKRILNTNTPFRVKSFFHGVKLSYLSTLVAVSLFLAFFLAAIAIRDWSKLAIAQGVAPAGPIAARVCIIIATTLVGIFSMWLISVGVSYKLGPIKTLKNTFVLMFGSILQSIFFVAMCMLPVAIIMLGDFFQTLGFMFFFFFGFAYISIVWMAYTQWIYDLYITPNIKAVKAEQESKKTPEQLEEEKKALAKETALQLIAAGKSELIGQPMMPVEERSFKLMSSAFTRSDIQQQIDRRISLQKDVTVYQAEHANDSEYVAYNKMFAEREKALTQDTKKGKKKKISSDNLLH